jgi:ureidoglycolate dehydrogenase (NAD+)
MAPAAPQGIDASDLRRFVGELLVANGVDKASAAQMAEVFLWANLRGVDSHGVARVPRYLELFDSGEANRAPSIKERRLRPGVAMIAADYAPGAVALGRGTDLACQMAAEQGVAWVSVRETVHAGAMGYYVERAARAGMIGIVMLAGMPNMGWPGAKGAAVATSPLAIGIPGDDGPFLLDMATAMIALGKINQYKIKGLPLPEGAAVTAEGVPTTDAALAKMPLPLGGMKGAGMSLAFELVTSVLSGVPVVAPLHARAEGAKRHRQNAVIIALDPSAFGDAAAIRRSVTATLGSIRGLTPLDPAEPVAVPGDRGAATAKKRVAKGVPIPKATWDELAALAEKFRIAPPQEA